MQLVVTSFCPALLASNALRVLLVFLLVSEVIVRRPSSLVVPILHALIVFMNPGKIVRQMGRPSSLIGVEATVILLIPTLALAQLGPGPFALVQLGPNAPGCTPLHDVI